MVTHTQVQKLTQQLCCGGGGSARPFLASALPHPGSPHKGLMLGVPRKRHSAVLATYLTLGVWNTCGSVASSLFPPQNMAWHFPGCQPGAGRGPWFPWMPAWGRTGWSPGLSWQRKPRPSLRASHPVPAALVTPLHLPQCGFGTLGPGRRCPPFPAGCAAATPGPLGLSSAGCVLLSASLQARGLMDSCWPGDFSWSLSSPGAAQAWPWAELGECSLGHCQWSGSH